MAGEGVVAAVVRGDGHDGAGAVAGEDVVAYPHWHFLAREGVDCVAAGEDAGDAAVDHTLALGAVADGCEVLVDGLLLLGRGELRHILAFGSEHHECDAEDGVGSCGEDFEVDVVAAVDLEVHLGTLGAAYPVALGFLD